MPVAPAIPTLELNDGRRIPQLGFGVFQVAATDTEEVVSTALAAGYRHVDTAAAYGNEAQVGRAVRALGELVYVTTKYFNPGEGFAASWRGLVALREQPAMRSIGVSTSPPPSWPGSSTRPDWVLRDPTLAEIAGAHGTSVAQVVIRWHLQIGTIVIPKSALPDRIRENIDVLRFELTDADMDAIAALDRGGRNGPDPDSFGFPTSYRGRARERA